MKMRSFRGFVALCSLAALAGCRATTPIPYLQKQGGAAHMVVDGKPFLMLAGELHNSTTSNLDFVKTQWSQLAAMHLNTVLAPVYWELMEPKEGQFDFTLVDGQIRAAGKPAICASRSCGSEAGRTACPAMFPSGSRPTRTASPRLRTRMATLSNTVHIERGQPRGR